MVKTLPEDPGFPSAVEAAVHIIDALISGGVHHAVVCPGSRSAPLALALVEASRAGRIQLHVRTDERTGAFLALGLATATRRPVPIIMTSGTAVANCLPAMVEASMAHSPLVVVSANRPLNLVGRGANQTIDQADIFGVHSVHTTSLDHQHHHPEVMRRRVAEALAAATHPIRGGGVHIDVPLAPPLVPEALDTALSFFGSAPASAAQTSPALEQSAQYSLPYGHITVDVRLRTLVIAGHVTDQRWAQTTIDALAGTPTIAEPFSPVPSLALHPATAAAMATTIQKEQRPEQLIVVGRPTLHRGVTQLLLDPTIPTIVVTETTTTPHTSTPVRYASQVISTGQHPEPWIRYCRSLSDAARRATRDITGSAAHGAAQGAPSAAENPHGKTQQRENLHRDNQPNAAENQQKKPTGLHMMATLVQHLHPTDTLVLGASSAVRDASYMGLPLPGVRTYANRGAAGIDGTISTAIGIAIAANSAGVIPSSPSGKSPPTAAENPPTNPTSRTIAVMGDLTFLHDITALNIGSLEPRPDNLLILVTDDSGGAIFETLEQGAPHLRTFDDGSAAFERVFGTPPHAHIPTLCTAFGINHHTVSTTEELAHILKAHAQHPAAGITVIHAQVDRGQRRHIEEHILQAVTP